MALIEPKVGPGLRSPTDNTKQHGRVVNPPRYSQLGGLDKATKVPTGDVNLNITKPGGTR